MESRHIKVHIVKGESIEYQAAEDRILRAILGKWGELRIFQVQILEDADIESKKQLEKAVQLDSHNAASWRRYTNVNMNSVIHG